MADQAQTSQSTELNSIELATELTIAWLNNPNNRVSATEVPEFLKTIHSTLNELSVGAPEQSETSEEVYTPAVSPRASIKKDHLISLIDGKPYKTLKRHLSRHGLTPDQYRQRYGLKSDYPMVAPNYSELRRESAKRIGLGNRGSAARQEQAAGGDEGAAPARGRQRRQADSGSTETGGKRGRGRPKKAEAES